MNIIKSSTKIGFLSVLLSATGLLLPAKRAIAQPVSQLDRQLAAVLKELGFKGQIQDSIEQRLGRPLDPARANVGRLLWFDTVTGLHNDNTCAGCHSPTRGF